MDKAKIVALLEKNVEWVAMGVGGLFLLFVAWTYGVSNPVSVEVGGQQYSPARVDEVVAESVKPLEAKLAEKRAPKFAVENVADQFYSAFNSANPAPEPKLAVAFDFKPLRNEPIPQPEVPE